MNGSKAKTLRREMRREAQRVLATRSFFEEYAASFAHYCVVAERRLKVRRLWVGKNCHVLIVRARKR